MKKRSSCWLCPLPSPRSFPHPAAALCWGHLGCKFPSWHGAEPQVQFVQLLRCLSGAGMHGRAVGAGWEQDGSRMGARAPGVGAVPDVGCSGMGCLRGWWLWHRPRRNSTG